MFDCISKGAIFTVSFLYETVLIPYYEIEEVYLRANRTANKINNQRARY
jgi:hypothetical protein